MNLGILQLIQREQQKSRDEYWGKVGKELEEIFFSPPLPAWSRYDYIEKHPEYWESPSVLYDILKNGIDESRIKSEIHNTVDDEDNEENNTIYYVEIDIDIEYLQSCLNRWSDINKRLNEWYKERAKFKDSLESNKGIDKYESEHVYLSGNTVSFITILTSKGFDLQTILDIPYNQFVCYRWYWEMAG